MHLRQKWIILLLLCFLCLNQIKPTGALEEPSARIGHEMIYDPVGERVLLFGGSIWENNRYTFYNELWSYTEGGWNMIDVPGEKPEGRFNIPMVYLPDHHQIFLFGGFSNRDRIGDTWTYDITDNTWTHVTTETSPPRRSDAAIAYDMEHEVVVMFGGYGLNDEILDDTWVFDFSEINWVEKTPENQPLTQYGGHMIYDLVNGKLLMYPGHWNIRSGGTTQSHGYGDEIWVYDYDEDNWTELETRPKPAGRYWFNIACDSTEGELVLFGGSGGGDNQLQDTWKYNYESNTWTRIGTGTMPPGRANSAMAYDASRDIIVLFGGSHFGHTDYGDTWILEMESGNWSLASGADNQSEGSSTGIPGFPLLGVLLGIVFIVWIKDFYKVRV